MTRGIDFAPVSNRESTLLRFASGYLILNGIFNGLVFIWLLVSSVLGRPGFGATSADILGIVILAILTAGLIWTGVLLGRGSRRGGLFALGFTLMPIAYAVLTPDRPSTATLVFSGLGVIVLFIIWRELH